MSNEPAHYQTWKKNPTGRIPTGSFCETCGRFNSRCTTVEVVVVNARQQVLLVQRKHDPEAGSWALPAGYLDWHETLKEAVVRELREETGVVLSPNEVHLVDIFDNPDRDKDGRENVAHCFLASIAHEPELTAGDDAQRVEWFVSTNLPKEIAFDHRQMIERALQRK